MKTTVKDGVSARSTGRSRRFVSLVSIVVLALTVFGAGFVVGGGPAGWNGAGARPTGDFSSQDGYQVVEDTWGVVRDDYVGIDNVDPNQIFYGAAGGLVEGLGDTNHSRFLDPDAANEFVASLQSDHVGIGVVIAANGDQVFIQEVIPGSPAADAGIQRGDVLLRLNGDDVTGLTLDELDPYFTGKAGDKITIEAYRPTTQETKTFEVVQQAYTIKTVSWSMLPDNVALIRISEFDQGTSDDLITALNDSRDQGATSVLLDLRNDPGGLLDELVTCASQFLDEGTVIFEQKDASGKITDETAKAGGVAVDTPVVVLVNRGSGSSSEIMAAALQYQGRSQVIGQTTAGTGTSLSLVQLKGGSMVLIGTDMWLTPDGTSIWHKGLTPNKEVLLPYGVLPLLAQDGQTIDQQQIRDSRDVQVEAGLAELTGKGSTGKAPRGTAGTATPTAGTAGLSTGAVDPAMTTGNVPLLLDPDASLRYV